MKRGIEISWGYDIRENSVVRITKRRGRLTLEEIGDLLRFENSQRWCGHYAIILNCSEETIGGNGLYIGDTPQGDAVDLYPIEEGETCPICGNYTPPFTYCPNCGTAWKDIDLNVEKLITSMREETARSIEGAAGNAAKAAWYWSYIGALDMVRQLGIITEKRRQELYTEAKDMKPQSGERE